MADQNKQRSLFTDDLIALLVINLAHFWNNAGEQLEIWNLGLINLKV